MFPAAKKFPGVTRILLFALILFYLSALVNFNLIPDCVPSNSDDYPYFSGGMVFSEINSVKARTMIHESVAEIFETDWYGSAYPVCYGMIFKISGNNAKLMVYMNFISIFTILVLFLYWFRKFRDKNLVAIAFLFSTNLIFFMFRYMPSCLNALQGFILFYFLFQISVEKEIRTRRKQVVYFIFLTLIFSFFRNYFVFYLIGLIPLGRSRIERINYGLVFIFSFFLASLYMKYFTAITLHTFTAMNFGNPAEIIRSLMIQVDHNSQVLIGFVKNFVSFKWSFLLFPYLFLVFTPFVLLVSGIQKRNPFVISVSLTGLTFLILMFLLYPVEPDYFLRHSLHLMLPLLFVFFSVFKTRIPVIILLFFFSFSFLQMGFSNILTENMQYEARLYERIHKSELHSELNKIRELVKDEERDVTTVLVHQSLLRTIGKQKVVYSLPFISENKKLIRYTFNPFTGVDPMTLFHRVPVHYFLIPVIVTSFDNLIIYENDYFKLCRNPDPLLENKTK